MALSDCARLVREHDHDRFLCVLYGPASVREDVFALLAFHHEIAKIPTVVREPMMGLIRLAWWREALDETYGGATVRRHEVALPLAEAIRTHALPRPPFDDLLEAQEQALEPATLETRDGFTAYAEAFGGNLHALWATILKGSEEEIAAARHVGAAWAMLDCVIHAVRDEAHGRLRLPLEGGNPQEAARLTVALIAEEIGKARALVPKTSPVLLPLVPLEVRLRALRSATDILRPSHGNLRVQMALLRKAMFRR